jgi:hypothetical protein
MTTNDRPGPSCLSCQTPPVVCAECVRALALQWFGAIARHPETGTDCIMCEQGPAVWCGCCFVGQVADYRAVLLNAGTRIGEPTTRSL